MTFILGLTGGIGSGKTAASQWFETQGIQVVDADVVAREIVAKDQSALAQIQKTFGDWVLLDTGELDRRALRNYIFQHPTARQQLEQITHPAIRTAILQQLQAATSAYVILVAPLLFENSLDKITNRTLLIDTSEDLQIARASQRDTQNIEQIKNIMAIQMPRVQKQQLADDIVLNEGELSTLYTQLSKQHSLYLQLSQDLNN